MRLQTAALISARCRGALAIAGLAAAAAQGQTVRGRATVSDTIGVPGVVVQLVDAQNRIAAQALTGDDGEFRLRAPAAGTYTLHTLRIGYRPGAVPGLALAAGEDREHVIRLHAVAFGLDTVRVASRAACAAHDAEASVAGVWQQARTALTAAQLTAGSPVLRAAFARQERAIDVRNRNERVLYTRRDSGFFSRTWTSLSADSLHRGGYVHRHADGTNSWFAPDLDVLLSEGFLRDHCFRLTRERDALGVRFEPARHRREIPEIRGTLWLDVASGELRRMEFDYVHVPFAEKGDPGGDMEFVRLANGGWAIARWSIRMPVFVERQRPPSGVPGAGPQLELTHVETRIASGQLSLVMRDRDTLYVSGRSLVLAGTREAPVIELVQIETPAASSRDSTRTAAQPLPEVTTRASSIVTEFEARRRMGGGQFLSRADFDKAPERSFADFMVTLPGARLARADGKIWVTNGRGTSLTNRRPESNRRFTMGRDATQACYSDVWIDGVQVYGKSADDPLFDINTIAASEIEGVEFYPSSVATPARFHRNGAECGAVVVWLRRR